METDSLSTEILEQALAQIKERISQIAAEMNNLQKAMAKAKEEERLMEGLVAIRSGIAPSQQNATNEPDNSTLISSKENHSYEAKSSVVSEVLRVLEEAGRPMHISELMSLLRQKAIPIPGAGTQANLIVHMRRDPRIVRPSRGMYALANWGLAVEAKPTTRRPRRRRKRRKTS